MTVTLSPRVDPVAAVELVDLIRQQLHRLIQEHERGANTQPNLAYQLAGALESLLQGLHGDRPIPVRRALNADAVAYVRRSVQVGRRLDMTRAFDRLNPAFGVAAEHGCFYGEVQRGCYQDASYDDRGRFSGLHHATWERQERHPYQALAYLSDDGHQVAWADDEGGEVA